MAYTPSGRYVELTDGTSLRFVATDGSRVVTLRVARERDDGQIVVLVHDDGGRFEVSPPSAIEHVRIRGPGPLSTAAPRPAAATQAGADLLDEVLGAP